MCRSLLLRFFPLFLSLITTLCVGQAPKSVSATPAQEAQRGLALSQERRCKEALPLLRTALRTADKDLKRQAGFAGVRCAMVESPDVASEFLGALLKDFPQDPEVLYLAVHTYSDLSTRAAQELAMRAPNSPEAHELNAESLELQEKWDQAKKEYEEVLKQNPEVPGIHFRLGRLLLSKPNPPPDMAEQAKKEFQQELKIDPTNAGAEFVLGEIARQSQQWDEAVQHFSRAAKLDAGFGDAYLGLGQSLISNKKFSEAIPPLENAVKLQPQNPAAHFNLATAYSRTGRKQDAEKEFAIHRRMTQKEPPAQDTPQ